MRTDTLFRMERLGVTLTVEQPAQAKRNRINVVYPLNHFSYIVLVPDIDTDFGGITSDVHC